MCLLLLPKLEENPENVEEEEAYFDIQEARGREREVVYIIHSCLFSQPPNYIYYKKNQVECRGVFPLCVSTFNC